MTDTNEMTTSRPSMLQRFFAALKLGPFGYLNCTQFLGAMNDNIYKLLIVYCFIALEGDQASNTILASVGAIYVIPFLLLSSTAGTMADRFSKRAIIVVVKSVECLVMLLGMFSFYIGSKTLAYGALFLLACHSTIFAPCKYGIVPEIVPPERISRANGILTSCTYMAIIVGTFLASFLVDVTDHNFMIAAGSAVLIALIGLYVSLRIPKTAPSGSEKEINPRFLSELRINLRLIFKQPSLLSAVLGSAFFLFVGSYAQLNMIPFALDALGLTDVQGGYLFLLTALGIGAGSLLAGRLSGSTVELGLVPIGGFGIAICCFCLSFFQEYVALEVLFVTLIGVFGGIYLVPLDSYIQLASPKTLRGQVIATTNFLGFFGVFCSAAMLYFLSEILGLRPAKGFFVMGLITLAFVTGISIAISGYVMRFYYMLTTRLAYRALVRGKANLQGHAASIFVSTLPSWPWAAFLIGSQARRILLFVVKDQAKPIAWYRRILLRILFKHEISSKEALDPTSRTGALIRAAIQRGTSVAIFLPASANADSDTQLKEVKRAWQHHMPVAFFAFKQRDKSLPHKSKFEAALSQL